MFCMLTCWQIGVGGGKYFLSKRVHVLLLSFTCLVEPSIYMYIYIYPSYEGKINKFSEI